MLSKQYKALGPKSKKRKLNAITRGRHCQNTEIEVALPVQPLTRPGAPL